MTVGCITGQKESTTSVLVLISCVLLFHLIIFETLFYASKFKFIELPVLKHPILTHVQIFLFLGLAKKASTHHSNSSNHSIHRYNQQTKISIFTGRGANKNHEIFKILDSKGPQTIGDIQKHLNEQPGLEVTYYASLNKRMHALEKGGYVSKICLRNSIETGFKAGLYVGCAKFYLASFLNNNSREEILNKIDDNNAAIIFADLVGACVSNKG